MILPSRVSLCWSLSENLHQLCPSLEPGQEKVPKMQPRSMGIDLPPAAPELPVACGDAGDCVVFPIEVEAPSLSQPSLHPWITEPWNRHTPGLTRTINWAKLVLFLGGKQLNTHFSGSLTVAS